jgi:hypothetical protein
MAYDVVIVVILVCPTAGLMDAQQVRKFVVKGNVRSGLDRLDMKTRILLISKESRFGCALQGV